jgi:general nucleoside transport system ATP-binding protein
MDNPFLEIRGVTKLFAKVIANRDVSFSVARGEVVALLGENGAGKSTIMKILYGLYRADSGSILIDGKELRLESPRDAMAQGISMIHQSFSLVGPHSVTENIILGSVRGVIDRRACERRIGDLARRYGFDIDPAALVRDLPVGVQQRVEILKALFQDARLLVMDEPTAVLTPQEAAKLMEFVKRYAAAGNSVIFITHKLKEVMEVADRVIVMRGGEVRGIVARERTNERELSLMMIGHELPPLPTAPAPASHARELLRLEGVSVRDRHGVVRLRDVSFTLRAGEILGIAGVSGNGQQELCEVIYGASQPASGTIRLDGRDIGRLGIRERIDLGIGYVPADRQKDGMVMEMTVAENMILKTSFDPRWRRGAFLDRRRIGDYARSRIRDYSIRTPGPDAGVRGLSGGNQQKVVVAREVDQGRRLILFDQPTRGLDLAAIDYVHATILAERGRGKCVLLISTELSEIFALSDRIAVLYQGAIQGIFPRAELTMERIGLQMAGYSAARH